MDGWQTLTPAESRSRAHNGRARGLLPSEAESLLSIFIEKNLGVTKIRIKLRI